MIVIINANTFYYYGSQIVFQIIFGQFDHEETTFLLVMNQADFSSIWILALVITDQRINMYIFICKLAIFYSISCIIIYLYREFVDVRNIVWDFYFAFPGNSPINFEFFMRPKSLFVQ